MADVNIAEDGFDSQNDSMPISIALMTAIQTKIDSSGAAKQVPMPFINAGSLAQIVVSTYVSPVLAGVTPRYLEQDLVSNMPTQIPGSVVKISGAYNYHPVHPIAEPGFAHNWLPFDYDEDHVPEDWIPNANMLHAQSSDLLDLRLFTTVDFQSRVRLLADLKHSH